MVSLIKLLSGAGYTVSIDVPSIPPLGPIVVTPVIPDLPDDIKPSDINLHPAPPPPEPIHVVPLPPPQPIKPIPVVIPLPPIDFDDLKKAIDNGESIHIDFNPPTK